MADEDTDAPTLLDHLMRHRARGGDVAHVMTLVGVVGLLLIAPSALSLLTQPWHLDAASPTALSAGGECSGASGASYTIDIDGRTHTCRGGLSKCPSREPVAVAYDPLDPAACRVAAHVDRLSPYERVLVALAALFAFTCIAGGTYLLSERRHRAEIADGAATASPIRRRLRRLSVAALILLPLTSLTAFAFIAALIAATR
ncbi:MAG: hypothetical protein IPK80_03980 [Nannocystis sp.]|nr:hypothetical protein [Nannocystis sp.]